MNFNTNNENINLFWSTVTTKEKEIEKKVRVTIKKMLGRCIETEDLEDLVGNVLTNLAEKVTYSGKTYNDEAHVFNSIIRSCWQTYRDSSIKAVNDAVKFNDYLNSELRNSITYVEEFDADLTRQLHHKNLYKLILDFLEAECTFLDAGIYKSRIFNDYTYDQLAENTGYSRSKCVSTVKRVQDKLEEHLRAKGYQLPTKKGDN